MKRIPKPIHSSLKCPHIFRNDIEDLERILTDNLKAKDFKIATNNYEFDSVKDIPNDLEKTHELTIRTSVPYISITLSGNGANIYLPGDDLAAKGALADLLEVFKRRQRLPRYACINSLYLVSLGIFFPSVGQILDRNSFWSTVFIVVGIIFLTLLIAGLIFSLHKYSTIEFVNKTDKPGFFKRNYDRIILGIFFAILGALVALGAQKWF